MIVKVIVLGMFLLSAGLPSSKSFASDNDQIKSAVLREIENLTPEQKNKIVETAELIKSRVDAMSDQELRDRIREMSVLIFVSDEMSEQRWADFFKIAGNENLHPEDVLLEYVALRERANAINPKMAEDIYSELFGRGGSLRANVTQEQFSIITYNNIVGGLEMSVGGYTFFSMLLLRGIFEHLKFRKVESTPNLTTFALVGGWLFIDGLLRTDITDGAFSSENKVRDAELKKQ